MKTSFVKIGLAAILLLCAGCVIDPYYDEPAPAYGYGYYGYGPAYYPWGGVDVDIHDGWGRGGYYDHDGGHGGYGHGWGHGDGHWH